MNVFWLRFGTLFLENKGIRCCSSVSSVTLRTESSSPFTLKMHESPEEYIIRDEFTLVKISSRVGTMAWTAFYLKTIYVTQNLNNNSFRNVKHRFSMFRK